MAAFGHAQIEASKWSLPCHRVGSSARPQPFPTSRDLPHRVLLWVSTPPIALAALDDFLCFARSLSSVRPPSPSLTMLASFEPHSCTACRHDQASPVLAVVAARSLRGGGPGIRA